MGIFRLALVGLLLTLPALAAPIPGELSEEEWAHLEQEKILVGRQTFLSAASAYQHRSVPVFITSDSVLSAFHSLLIESMARVEWSRGQALREVLPVMRERLPAVRERFHLDPDLLDRAVRRTRILLATARLLLGNRSGEGYDPLHFRATEEVARVNMGRLVVPPPEWYGPPDASFAGVEYGRFRPSGMLSRVPETAALARALSWLAAVPFRPDREEEVVSFLLLAAAAEGHPRLAEAFGGMTEILGPEEDVDLLDVPPLPEVVTPEVLAGIQWVLVESAGAPRVRDQVGLPGSRVAPTLRLLPLSAPVDSVLLQRIADRMDRDAEAGLPSALAVAAALGSNEAAASLPEGDREVVAAAVERGFAGGDSLGERYLRALAVLQQPVSLRAPALFRSDAWRTKSLQTLLSGFALWRHAFDVRIKDGTRALGGRDSSGWVEPVPEFFAALRPVVRETGALLADRGSGARAWEAAVEASLYEALADVVDSLAPAAPGEEGEREYWGRLYERCGEMPVLAAKGNELFRLQLFEDDAPPRDGATRGAAAVKLRGIAADLRRGRREPDRMSRVMCGSAAQRFEQLVGILQTLARLAKKQLAGRPFDEEEQRWIRGYGHALARVTGAGDGPSDDAPAAVSIFGDPAAGAERVLAVGRPRALWILYPDGEEEVLCRGAVLPFYELALPRAPTDQEWMAMLDGEDPPRSPAPLRRIFAEESR